MPAKKAPKPAPTTLKQGRRSHEDKRSGRWRLTIRKVTATQGTYSWDSFVVQGWQSGGKWQRRRFKTLAAAEAFKASKALELLPDSPSINLAATSLSPERIRDAETALALIAKSEALYDASGAPVTIDLAKAATHYLKHLRDIYAVEQIPMADAVALYLQDRLSGGVKPITLKSRRSRLLRFVGWVTMRPRFDAMSISPAWSPGVASVSAGDVEQFLDSLRGDNNGPAAPWTTKSELVCLRSFFEWCRGRHGEKPIPGCSRRMRQDNPCDAIAPPKVSAPPPACLSVDQARDMMRYIEDNHPRLVPWYSIAIFCGVRPGRSGELQRLANHPGLIAPCSDAAGRPLLDLERGILTIPASVSKTGRRRVIPISANLAAWLERFPGPLTPVGFDAENRLARNHLKLGFDTLRHSFISFRVAIVGKAQSALEAGNSEKIIDSHYLHLPSKAEAKAFWAISPTTSPPNPAAPQPVLTPSSSTSSSTSSRCPPSGPSGSSGSSGSLRPH